MFERLVLQLSNREDYKDIFVLSFVLSLLSVILVESVVNFRAGNNSVSGLMAVLFTSLAVSYPFITYTLREEKEEVKKRLGEKKLLKRHARQMELYLSFFIGSSLAFSLATFMVPESFFTLQNQILRSIGAPTGAVVSGSVFVQILQNNIWVMLVTFVLSFFLSSGIIFMIAWHASVLGVFIGRLSSSALHIPVLTFCYLPHGLLEIGGYVLAGIAGSLLSYHTQMLMFEEESVGDITKRVNKDVLVLMAASGGFVLAGAAVEAFVACSIFIAIFFIFALGVLGVRSLRGGLSSSD